MKLERIKCKPFERAQDLCVSESYIVGCTGRRAVILDKQLNLIHTVEGLEYVYCAEVSPDETKLLLISNANKFYIVDLQTFEKTRVTVKAPYNENLEGRGCWSFDGEAVWIPVNCNSAPVNSTLRRYPIADLSKYEDFLADKYYVCGISRLENRGTYFITGYNRQSNEAYFIYFDGTGFEEFTLDSRHRIIPSATTVDMESGVITVPFMMGCMQFTPEGKPIKAIPHPDPKTKTIQTSDMFLNMFSGDAEKQNGAKELCAAFGLERISSPDYINKYIPSSCGSYIYMAAESGLYLLDDANQVLAFVPEQFGVQNVEQIEPGLIAAATWSGVKLYKLCP